MQMRLCIEFLAHHYFILKNEGSGPPYTQAVANIRLIGVMLAHLILHLHVNNKAYRISETTKNDALIRLCTSL